MRDGEVEDLRFEVGPVELELTVAVSEEAGSNAKVRFWVIELGAGRRRVVAGDSARTPEIPAGLRVGVGPARHDS